MADYYIELSLEELSQELGLSKGLCIELVEHGVVQPLGEQPAEWAFDLQMLGLLRRAMRLHRDLGLEWSDVAFVIQLLDERDRLRTENQRLRQQLARFLED